MEFFLLLVAILITAYFGWQKHLNEQVVMSILERYK